MGGMICFVMGVLVGVIYEKQIRRHKEAVIRAVNAAKNEINKG
jgi:uncharacterized membrane protein YoaK (UPF0700 family)